VNNFSELSKELANELKEEVQKVDIDKGLISEIAGDIAQNQEKINHHGQRASSIVKGMLEHSRAGDGKKELTGINALCDEYLRLAYHGMRAKDNSFNADFKTEFDKTLPKINIVPQDIGRVLLNLINNAFYSVAERSRSAVAEAQKVFGEKETAVAERRSSVTLSGVEVSRSVGSNFKPMVIVSSKNLDGKIEIRVKDNGPGIPSDIKDKIFQPFFTTKPTGQGTGLGLSLSYDIIKAHGGELKVESVVGKGSEFAIILPFERMKE